MTHNQPYNPFREAFDVWEKHTARYWDQVLRNPLFLDMLGTNLRTSLGFQRAFQGILELTWRTWGLPTRYDQERTLHELNQLDTQIQQISRRMDALSHQTSNSPTQSDTT